MNDDRVKAYIQMAKVKYESFVGLIFDYIMANKDYKTITGNKVDFSLKDIQIEINHFNLNTSGIWIIDKINYIKVMKLYYKESFWGTMVPQHWESVISIDLDRKQDGNWGVKEFQITERGMEEANRVYIDTSKRLVEITAEIALKLGLVLDEEAMNSESETLALKFINDYRKAFRELMRVKSCQTVLGDLVK